MPRTRNGNAFASLALTAVVAAVAAVPASAAVIRSTPATEVVFASELRFVAESRAELAFDASLGTLNAVTLAFDGTMTVNLLTAVTAATPDATATTLAVRYGGRPAVTLDPIVVPVTYTERTGGPDAVTYPYTASGSASAARSFQISIPAEQYGTYGSFYTDYRFTDFRPGTYSTFTDAIFRGSVTALFDYTPVDGGVVVAEGGTTNVPEPASLALLGFGLAGAGIARAVPKTAARRRAA